MLSSHYDHEANLLDVYMSRLRAKFEASRAARVQHRARRRLSAAVKSIGARLRCGSGRSNLTMVGLSSRGTTSRKSIDPGPRPAQQGAVCTDTRHLGEDFATLNPQLIDSRIRETSDFQLCCSSSPSMIQAARSGRSSIHEFRGMPIPDDRARVFNAFLTGTGELRVGNSFWGRSMSRSPRR